MLPHCQKALYAQTTRFECCISLKEMKLVYLFSLIKKQCHDNYAGVEAHSKEEI